MLCTIFAQWQRLRYPRVFVKYRKKVLLLERIARTYSVSRAVWQKENETARKRRWSVLFFGSDNFALESLKNLHEQYRLDKLCRLEVVTSSDSNRNVIFKYTKENDIAVHTWPLKSVETGFDVGIVVSFGYLIPSDLIHSFPLGMINVHASLLPRWRGAAPIIHSLINGETQTGITIMKIAPKKFDIGEIVDQVAIEIGPDETMPELLSKLAILGADILIRTLDRLPGILENAKPQSSSGITYAPKVNKSSISQINWNTMTAKNIYDLQRALTGTCPLAAKLEDTNVKLFGIRRIEAPSYAVQYQDHVPGTAIYRKDDNVLTVKCKEESWIAVTRIRILNRQIITAADFDNGFIIGRKRKHVVFG